ncbi:Rv3654c family TadE-like protein [uncultured Actinomyces sp.]|uniref:Rv3654c family TadE-like protein n=1 Tax=uncultured Actinomyces sp. TaxID=249061 RepID=UPI0015C050BE|nr:Rv3654c family TadE-like protein [uncultured Actinomyces sp.]
MGKKRGSDEGSGTIMVVGVLAVLSVLACSALVYIALLVAGNRAQNIADLSALAGADVSATAQWESVEEKACRAANEVAQENGAMLSSCHCESVDTIVTVRVSSGWGWSVFRSARAGVDNESALDALEGPAPRLAPQASHQHSASFPKSLSVWHPHLSGVQLSMT